MILVKFIQKDDAKGAFLLSRTGPIQCLPGDTYLCGEEQLKILDKNDISYQVLSVVDYKPIYSKKVAVL